MEWLKLLISLIGIIGLVVFIYWFMRKMNRSGMIANGNKLRIVDRANLGRDKMLLVIAVAGKLMLVGVSNERVEKICDIDITEDEYTANGTDGTQKVLSFSEIIAGMSNGKRKSKDMEVDTAGKEDAFEIGDSSGDKSEH